MAGRSIKRRLADMVGHLLGAEVVAKRGAAFWPEQYFVRQLFALLAPDCVFDVGANEGQYARELRRGGFAGTILSFEPQPDVYPRLAAAAKDDPRWHTFPVALGREPGTAAFNVMAGDVFSSFRAPVAGGDFADANTVRQTVDVRVERLDALLPQLRAEHGFVRPFLKMDTQGFDLEVLAGAGAEARAFCALLSEVSLRRLYADAPTMEQSLAAFRDAGFVLAALHSVHPWMPLKAIEFNCYAVRDDLVEAGAAG